MFDRATAYHEAAHVAAWHLENGIRVDVILNANEPHVQPRPPWLPPVTTREEGIRRALVRTRVALAGAFAERILLGDQNAWLPSIRSAAPSPADAAARDFHSLTSDMNFTMEHHRVSDDEADAIYSQAVSELTLLFRDRAFTGRVRRIGEYLTTVDRGLIVRDEELRKVAEGIE